jgi:cell division septum initiation protein DivIVA
MKQSMDSAIAFRRQINAFLTRWQHEMQGVAQEDVDSLMDRMGDLQKTVVRRIDAIADRLEEIAARLNRLESHDPEKSRKAAGTSSADERKPASAKAFSTAKTSKSPKSEKPKKSAKSGKSAKAGRSAKPGSSAKKRTRKQGY